MKKSQYIIVFAIGIIIRLYLQYSNLYQTFSQRYEIISSYNSIESSKFNLFK